MHSLCAQHKNFNLILKLHLISFICCFHDIYNFDLSFIFLNYLVFIYCFVIFIILKTYNVHSQQTQTHIPFQISVICGLPKKKHRNFVLIKSNHFSN
jgi:Ca2+/Na+ antiporter